MRADALRETLAGLDGPILVCAQAGNVNTGAFDPLPRSSRPFGRSPNAWLHVDGAFGLWAAAVPALRDRVAGLAGADSWTTDAHKWLNVPYDSGIVICRDPAAHHAGDDAGRGVLRRSTEGGERDSMNWVPESSRRARGFPVYAALRVARPLGAQRHDRSLLRAGAAHGRWAAVAPEGVTILNDVVLNQVLVRFSPPEWRPTTPAATDDFTRRVIAAVQADGTCWLGGTTWHGMAAMRISVSNWSTTEADADMSVEAILRCAREVGAGAGVA